MARTAKKNVYERIEDQQNKIREVEEMLEHLKEELQSLYSERDELEMKQLFERMKESGLTIDKAIELLNNKTNK